MAPPSRPQYSGSCRKLLLAFDIGTTFSGISYSILDPGKVPDIKPVTRYPSQECAGGDVKIPTVIYYSKEGKVCAIGAETMKEGTEVDAKENGWSKAQCLPSRFKLHLRPSSNVRSSFAPAGFYDGKDLLPPLPPNKSVVEVISDFMRYLFDCTKSYIRQTHGQKLWASVESNIAFVLTHPNGWGGPQQVQMRQAAVLAGLVPDTDEGTSRITFVTEGEASLHFCLQSGLSLASGDAGTLIVDAGGGTIDITAYRQCAEGKFEEVSVPTCFFQGAAYVTVRAQHYFEGLSAAFNFHFANDSSIPGLLSGTRFHDDVETLTSRFDKGTKHVFKNPEEPYHIQFASHRERDPALNIRGGRLTVTGCEISKFFEPSITCIVNAIHAQRMAAQAPIKSICLVGGFSASTWLYENVREQIEPLGVSVSRPDTHVNKAVSSGAVSFYLDNLVSSRVARVTYGATACAVFDINNPHHQQRWDRVILHPATGEWVLPGMFGPILRKGTKVVAGQEFRQSLVMTVISTAARKKTAKIPVLAYSGIPTDPLWVHEHPASFFTLCTVEADISKVQPEWRVSSVGTRYQMLTSFTSLLADRELKSGQVRPPKAEDFALRLDSGMLLINELDSSVPVHMGLDVVVRAVVLLNPAFSWARLCQWTTGSSIVQQPNQRLRINHIHVDGTLRFRSWHSLSPMCVMNSNQIENSFVCPFSSEGAEGTTNVEHLESAIGIGMYFTA
ncbi:hypothetical protein NMY22_g6267 [Coprinellus aureogranulatus]|nr:hypothetical protein NMY22_g6267 [Coprinellus aureogranulatus]